MLCYVTSVAKATVVNNSTSNCLTMAYKQYKNYYHNLALQQDRQGVFLQNIIIFTWGIIFKRKNRPPFKISHFVYIFTESLAILDHNGKYVTSIPHL